MTTAATAVPPMWFPLSFLRDGTPRLLFVAAAVCLLCWAGKMSAQEMVSPTPAETPAATATPTPEPTVGPAPSAAPRVLYPAKGLPDLGGTRPGNQTAGTANLAMTFLVLAGLCAGGWYLLRRQPGFVAGFKGGPRKLNVSESRSLGNRQFLVVVEYENERMLLGVTPGKIDYLCPLRAPGGDAAAVFPAPGGANP